VDIYLMRTSATEGNGAHLSPLGRQLARAIGHKIRTGFAPRFSHFVSSAAPCCVQSAELFAERTDYLGIIEIWPELGGGVPEPLLAKRILALGHLGTVTAAHNAIVLVGDEPWLSALGAVLVGRPTFPQLMHAQISMVSGGQPAWFFRPDAAAQAPLLVA
jgi:phosphohistidine phosphatase SixA